MGRDRQDALASKNLHTDAINWVNLIPTLERYGDHVFSRGKVYEYHWFASVPMRMMRYTKVKGSYLKRVTYIYVPEFFQSILSLI